MRSMHTAAVRKGFVTSVTISPPVRMYTGCTVEHEYIETITFIYKFIHLTCGNNKTNVMMFTIIKDGGGERELIQLIPQRSAVVRPIFAVLPGHAAPQTVFPTCVKATPSLSQTQVLQERLDTVSRQQATTESSDKTSQLPLMQESHLRIAAWIFSTRPQFLKIADKQPSKQDLLLAFIVSAKHRYMYMLISYYKPQGCQSGCRSTSLWGDFHMFLR